jgi:polysaccharide export outer membrane protein
MQKITVYFLFLLVGLFIPFSLVYSQQSPSEPQPYTLGPDDAIDINVANHLEFSGTFVINANGKIQYKTLGEIEASGLTRQELEARVKQKVAEYVVTPEVSVSISDYKSKAFYVLGEVSRPGKYFMKAENITVKEAIIMAGLPTQFAALQKAKIITPGVNGSTIKEVDLNALLYTGDLKENILINPGDSLFIPAEMKAPAENKEKIQEEDRQKLRDKLSGINIINNPDALHYTLGPEDVVEINVLDHLDFSGIFPISLDGKLQYKFLGDIDVRGMTRGQLEEKIKTLLSGYITSPQVNVTITEFKSKTFYVLGEVHRPGKYYMRSESMTVKDAVVMAGLPTTAASLRKAKVTTPGVSGGITKEVDLYAVLYEGDMKDNITINPGDSLYIPAAMTESANEKFGNNVFDPVKYTLGPDDVIIVDVMSHPDFSGTYPVNLEGKIQYKFIGDIYVTGMTKAQLAEKIKGIISPYVPSAQVNVTISEFKSKAFYVVGEVTTPGKYYMRADSLPVSEAVVMAGLPTTTAAMRKTEIITPGLRNRKIRKVNLYALLYKGDLTENLMLNPGDYLYVPSTVLAKIIRIISPVSSTIGLAAGPATDVGNGRAGVAAAIK